MKALVILALLTAGVVSIAARIEVLNQRAGGVLPIGQQGEFQSKWRVAPTNEWYWRKVHSIEPDRPLTSAEEAQMRSDRAQASAESDLLDLVGSWGVLQYPLCVLLIWVGFAAGIAQPTRSTRAACCVFAVTGAIGLAVAVARDYYGSLGW